MLLVQAYPSEGVGKTAALVLLSEELLVELPEQKEERKAENVLRLLRLQQLDDLVATQLGEDH